MNRSSLTATALLLLWVLGPPILFACFYLGEPFFIFYTSGAILFFLTLCTISALPFVGVGVLVGAVTAKARSVRVTGAQWIGLVCLAFVSVPFLTLFASGLTCHLGLGKTASEGIAHLIVPLGIVLIFAGPVLAARQPRIGQGPQA